MDNSFHNNNNNRNQESSLRFFCHHHGTINGWQPVKSLFHIFPSCRQTHTFPRNLKAASAKDLRKHNTITEVWIFRPGAWQGACVATSSFSKGCKLDWWQQLAKFSPPKEKKHLWQAERSVWCRHVVLHGTPLSWKPQLWWAANSQGCLWHCLPPNFILDKHRILCFIWHQSMHCSFSSDKLLKGLRIHSCMFLHVFYSQPCHKTRHTPPSTQHPPEELPPHRMDFSGWQSPCAALKVFSTIRNVCCPLPQWKIRFNHALSESRW